jgi:hypothetical protein
MKRCPQCDFIYLDTDEVCDLDGAKLVQAADPALAFNEATKVQQSSPRSKSSRSLLRAFAGGLLLGALLFSVYWVFAKRQQTQVNILPLTNRRVQPIKIAPLPTPQWSPSPQESPFIPPSVPQADQPKRIAMSKDPVSTSPDAKPSGPIWIKLSNGARIEAEDVWRTKDGVWYRSNGVVTLIKANRVKAIEKAK